MKALFFTDMGRHIELVRGLETTRIGRYAAWEYKGRGKPEVLATAENLEELQEAYGNLEMLEISGPSTNLQGQEE